MSPGLLSVGDGPHTDRLGPISQPPHRGEEPTLGLGRPTRIRWCAPERECLRDSPLILPKMHKVLWRGSFLRPRQRVTLNPEVSA